MPTQRYVSHELTHFVGRDLRNPSLAPEDVHEQQYQRLIKILRQGELGKLNPGPGWSVIMSSQRGAKLSSNMKYAGQMVCFCDIPVQDLNLHMEKYSQFGLSFRKTLLINRGATPVFYISQESVIRDYQDTSPIDAVNFRNITLKDAFDAVDEERDQLLDAASSTSQGYGKIVKGYFNLNHLVFSRLKFFDAAKEETDETNFYMEREWRITGSVPFSLAEVVRIILPHSFAGRFRQDIPDFCGQLTFPE